MTINASTLNVGGADSDETAPAQRNPRLVRRVGLADQVAVAQRMLPEIVDLDRDEQLRDRIGSELGAAGRCLEPLR